jgi:hypothetical protein
MPVGQTISGNPVLRALVVAQSVDFVIPSGGGSVNLLNAYTLNFPAGAVCDPNAQDTQTGYANKQWDAPCTVATGDVAVRATLKWSNGNLYADFSPALRFVPGKVVTIGTNVLAGTVQAQASAGITDGWAIAYASGIEAAASFDAVDDASLRTVVVGSTGRIWRRIKHFSGYMINTAEGYVPCDPNAGDPLCEWVDDDAS